MSSMTGKFFIFIAGSFSNLIWSSLPSIYLMYFVFILICISAKKFPKICCFLIGVIWMASVGHWQCSLQLSSSQFSQPILIIGKVSSLIHQKDNIRFNVSTNNISNQDLLVNRNIRLSWRNPDWQVAQGQTVQLQVKLKPPHGLANEAGFNYQQWLFSEGIQATGYVKASDKNTLLNAEQSIRQITLNNILNLELDSHKWVTALAIGYRGLLLPDDWLLVQRTGVAHLIAISGLHLALVASMSYFIVAWFVGLLASRVVIWQKLNIHVVAILITVVSTFLYASLAGFGLPTLRAWLMICLFTGLFVFNKNLASINILLIAVSGFIVLSPLSLFGASFWLSFSAVLIISFVFWLWPVKSASFSLRTIFFSMIRIQLSLSVLMLPIVAWQFSYVSLVSPLVNLIAVPVVTFILVPMCLLGVIFLAFNVKWSEGIFQLSESILNFGLDFLTIFNELEGASLALRTLPIEVWLLSFWAILMFFFPYLIIRKKWLLVLLLPLCSYFMPSRTTDWEINVLDVGQGLSVMITKGEHVLIYDVGAAYPSGFNMADSVILPMLQANNLKLVDKVILSHSDNDHAGSLPVLAERVDITQVMTNKDLCREGYEAQWQGLTLQVLWPDNPSLYSDNNGSCVLKISDQYHSILLAGDIDKNIEKQLVAKYGEALVSDILVAPHHGSNTSSSIEFINAVSADYVVFSQGFMNRWQFPRAKVVTRYQNVSNLKPMQLSTSETGQVLFNVEFNQNVPISVSTYRQDIYPFWYANMPKCCSS